MTAPEASATDPRPATTGPRRLADPFAARGLAARLGAGAPTGETTVALADAVGRVTAADVTGAEHLPRFACSAMDGYAVRARDTAGATRSAPVVLDLVGEARAGRSEPRSLGPGDAHRISTGARVPPGADAVVRLEEATERDGAVEVRSPVAPGRDVRPAGEDVAPGAVVLRAGERLHPGSVALLAGLGIRTVRVRAAPTVTVLVTGDELTAGGGPASEDAVHDVSGVAVPALLAAAGATVADVVRIGDDLEATSDALRAATGDLVVTSGGVSVGRHDHVRRALEAVGAVERAAGVAMRPGGPTWFGTLTAPDGDVARPVLGLPGPPAAALLAATLLAAPIVDAMLGRPAAEPRNARLARRTAVHPQRHTVLWARSVLGPDGEPASEPAAHQSGYRLRALPACDALVIVPPGREPLAPGTRVRSVPVPGAAPA